MKFTIKSSFLNAIKNKSKWRLTLRKVEEKNERERERERERTMVIPLVLGQGFPSFVGQSKK